MSYFREIDCGPLSIADSPKVRKDAVDMTGQVCYNPGTIEDVALTETSRPSPAPRELPEMGRQQPGTVEIPSRAAHGKCRASCGWFGASMMGRALPLQGQETTPLGGG